MGKWIVSIVLCIFGGMVMFFGLTANTTIAGDDIKFVADSRHQITITSEELVTVEAASQYGFFVVRTSNDEVMLGMSAPVRLGFENFKNNYYESPAQQIRRGTWVIEKGTHITFHLSSVESTITVLRQVTQTERINIFFVSILCAFGLWVAIFIIVLSVLEK